MKNVQKTHPETFVPEGLNRKPRLLVIDDDLTLQKLLEFHLKQSGAEAYLAQTGEDGLKILKKLGAVDLVVLDLHLPGISGLETLKRILKSNLAGAVVVMTAFSTLETAIKALKIGAYDFVTKSSSFDDLRLAIRNALENVGLKQEVEILRARLGDSGSGLKNIIGSSAGIKAVVKLVKKVKDSNITVLLEGESGTGKEMIAQAIHFESQIASRPFVAINCAAIPENLLESVLFGHEKGAFTGATERRVGKFEEASEGTLFLDEIGELDFSLQAKILRVLQTREVEPIGGKTKTIKVRVVSATHLNLAQEVEKGKFRKDLFYRLAVFPINIPPLRERPEDIPPLLAHFLEKFNKEEEKKIKDINPDTQKMLSSYDWPGNVRELENMMYRAVVLCETDQLGQEDFPVISLAGSLPSLPASHPEPSAHTFSPEGFEGDAPFQSQPKGDTLSGINHYPPQSTAPSMSEMEQTAIYQALAASGGNVAKTARTLKIGRATLYRKFRKYGISPA